MNNHTRKLIQLGVILSISLAIASFILAQIPNLAENNWRFSGLKLDEYSFISPIIILAISVATGIIFKLSSNIISGISRLPDEIKKETAETVYTLKNDIDDFKQKLSSGIVKHEEYTYRALIYYENQGIIKNGFSGDVASSRNILFSNKTINLILREIKKVDSDVLKKIGFKASDRFAEELVTSIREMGNSNDLYDWIKHWINFDSDAGFGKFELGSKNPNEWKKDLIILLKYSFLTTDPEIRYHKEEHKICDFITGYIEGIINHFPPPVLSKYNLKSGKILISHDIDDSNECVSAGRDPSEGCVFHIRNK